MSVVLLVTRAPLSFTGGSGGIECGVATGQFAQSLATLETAVQTGKLSFWWNWGTAPQADLTKLPGDVAETAQQRFVPMLWGNAPPADYDFLRDAEGDVMGYNEPDLYGPPCCNCAGKQRYYPATSSGWITLFNPVSGAKNWQATINSLSANRSADTVRRIVSPSMANGAVPAPGVDCTQDPAVAGNPMRCEGWLSLFKAAALQLPCARLDGTQTNCWDVIDAIQIHSYAKAATDVLARIDGYLDHFAEDFNGSNGRSPKELWLTEVAAGSSDEGEVAAFAQSLMSPHGGLADRSKYGRVARVSWFSEFFFPGFNMSGAPVGPNEMWVSTLFQPFGGLTKVGSAFFANCASPGGRAV